LDFLRFLVLKRNSYKSDIKMWGDEASDSQLAVLDNQQED